MDVLMLELIIWTLEFKTMSYLKERKPSFSGLFNYTDELKKMILEFRDEKEYAKERVAFESLFRYHDCLKKSARLKTQTDYCRQVMEELNPGFCKGYFKRKS